MTIIVKALNFKKDFNSIDFPLQKIERKAI